MSPSLENIWTGRSDVSKENVSSNHVDELLSHSQLAPASCSASGLVSGGDCRLLHRCHTTATAGEPPLMRAGFARNGAQSNA